MYEDLIEHTVLPRNILDGMLKYKSMALDVVTRECHYNVYRLSYVENFYYQRLQFLYHFLQINKIDFVLFLVPPHHAGEYILYSLCEVMNIKKMVLIGVMPGGEFIPTCDIYDESSGIMGKYRDAGMKDYYINDTFREYINRVNNHKTYSKSEIRAVQNKCICLCFHSLTGKRS